MPQSLSIKFENIKKNDSNYRWVNIELGDTRVGKARIKKIYRKIVIKNINIFPEFERRGFAKQTVDLFKEIAREIIAENVRATAREFWKHRCCKLMRKSIGSYHLVMLNYRSLN